MSRQDHIKKLIIAHSRRLQKLKEQQALLGISTEPRILIEIEDIEAKIAELQEELEEKEHYNLKAVQQLLLESFSSDELRRFLYDFPEFRRFSDEFSTSMSKDQMVTRLIEFSERQRLTSDLLISVREHNPRQYFRFEDQLFSEGPSHETIDQKISQLSPIDTQIQPLDNPYVVGNPIQPDNMRVFLGRFDIAKSIINEVRKPGQKPSILLYGRRRMGKTSALLNISHLMHDPNLVVVYISGQSTKFHTNINFCYYLVREIINRFEQNLISSEQFRQAGFLTKSTFEENPILTLSEFFEESHKVLNLHNKYCLLTIDEYEEIDQHVYVDSNQNHNSHITRELLLELRETLQHKPRFMFLFAGIHFLRDLSKVNWSEIFINVKTLHISFLERTDGYRLLTEPVPEMRYNSKNVIEKILDLTGCQPFLLQAIASELVNILNSEDTKIVTEAILDEAVSETINYN